MYPESKDLALLKGAVGILEIDVSVSDAFDFRTVKCNSRLVFFLDEIVVKRLAVLCDRFGRRIFVLTNIVVTFYMYFLRKTYKRKKLLKEYNIEKTS